MKLAVCLLAGLSAVAVNIHAQHFPPLDRDNPPKSRTVLRDQYCMTARKHFQSGSAEPLFRYDFAAPGASGSALIDSKTVATFRNAQHLRIRADVSPGNHQFRLVLDRPATLTFMVSSEDFRYCQP